MGNLREEDEAILVMLDTLTRYWQENKIKVILCKSEHICTNSDMREKFDIFVSKMEIVRESIVRYKSLAKSYQKTVDSWPKSDVAYVVLCSTEDHFEAAVEQAKNISDSLTELDEAIHSFSVSNPH